MGWFWGQNSGMENKKTAATVIEISTPGGPEVLKLATRTVSSPSEGQVLIKVEAAGVNRPDIMQRLGYYPPPPGASDIPGLEIAGTIEAIGEGVTNFNIDDKVIALITGGGYASYALAPIETVLPLPKGFSMIEGAGIAETFFTVWSNVFDRAHLSGAESILVHGGTSGIGTTAIMLCKAFRHKVYTTVGSVEKCEHALALGADIAINYNTQDFSDIIMTKTEGKGVNVIIDMVAGDYAQRNLNTLAVGGRLVQIACLAGAKVEIDLMKLMLKRQIITGSTLRARDNVFKGAIAKNLLDHVWPLFEVGKIRPIIDSVFPLADAKGAHEKMETSLHMGKIILTP